MMKTLKECLAEPGTDWKTVLAKKSEEERVRENLILVALRELDFDTSQPDEQSFAE